MLEELLPLTLQALRRSGPGYVGGAAGDLAHISGKKFDANVSWQQRLVSHYPMGQHGHSSAQSYQ